eukprot:RCo006030
MAHLSFDLRRQYLSKKQFPRLLEELTRAVVDVQPEDILGFISLWALLRRAGDQVTEPSLAHVQELLDEGTCDACTAVCNEVLSSSEKASSVTPGEGSEAYLERALEEAQRLEKRLKDFLRRDERLPRGRVTEAGWLANELHNTARRFSSIHANLVNQTQETHPTAEARQNGFALLSALRREDSVATGECLEQPCDLSLINKEGHTPLTLATSKELSEVSLKLIELNADVNFVTKDGDSALIWASCKGLLEVCKKLLEHHADVNFTDRGGKSPLVWAARNGFPEICEVLLEAKANAAYVSPAGRTPLMWAARSGLKEICGKLIQAKANIHQADKDGKTALLWAAEASCRDVCVSLLAAKADFTHTDIRGRSMVYYASLNADALADLNVWSRDHSERSIADAVASNRAELKVQLQLMSFQNDRLGQKLEQARAHNAKLSDELNRTKQQLNFHSTWEQQKLMGHVNCVEKFGFGALRRCTESKSLDGNSQQSLAPFLQLLLQLPLEHPFEYSICPHCGIFTKDLPNHYRRAVHACPLGCQCDPCHLFQHFLSAHREPSSDDDETEFMRWLSIHFAIRPLTTEAVVDSIRHFVGSLDHSFAQILTPDNIAALHFLTLDTEFRHKANTLLLDKNADLSPVWHSIIRHIDRGLGALKPLPWKVTFYRGTDKRAPEGTYKEDQFLVWPAFTSVTTSLDVVKELFETEGSLFIVNPDTAKSQARDVAPFSALIGEQEVIYRRNTWFRVAEILTGKYKEDFEKALGKSLAQVDVYVLEEVTHERARSVLTSRAGPTSRTARYGLALLDALHHGDLPKIERWLANPGPLDDLDKDGHSALTLAASKGLEDACAKLIDLNVDVNHVTKDGDSPLIWASCKGLIVVVLKLIEARANVNFADKTARSPLMWAAQNGHSEVCDILLESKASATHRS